VHDGEEAGEGEQGENKGDLWKKGAEGGRDELGCEEAEHMMAERLISLNTYPLLAAAAAAATAARPDRHGRRSLLFMLCVCVCGRGRGREMRIGHWARKEEHSAPMHEHLNREEEEARDWTKQSIVSLPGRHHPPCSPSSCLCQASANVGRGGYINLSVGRGKGKEIRGLRRRSEGPQGGVGRGKQGWGGFSSLPASLETTRTGGEASKQEG